MDIAPSTARSAKESAPATAPTWAANSPLSPALCASTELIYCFDLDRAADPRGSARADHCDQTHVGFDP
jgi:hypothetical protein